MAEMRESNKRSEGSLTVDVDVSDALKGLKALKREANEVVSALKTIASFLNKNNDIAKNLISVFSTQELISELVGRANLEYKSDNKKLQYINIRPYGKGVLHWDTALDYAKINIEGEASILIYKK
jgi:hypothetical protein